MSSDMDMHENSRPRALHPFVMGALAIITGTIAGFGAVLFRALIAFFHNALFLGQFSFHYDANIHTPPSPLGWGIVAVPVLGALVVAWLVKTWAPEAKGHGVPEVIDAIYYKKAIIGWPVAIVKSLASAISIGSGGSVGREGPIIQIGSTFGSVLGTWIRMPARQRATLIAAGAGGGIAATFNCPLGGVAFAIELILPCVTATTVAPVILATVVAAYIGRWAWGLYPSFYIPELLEFHPVIIHPLVLLLFLPFAVIAGATAALFIKGLYWTEDVFDGMPGNYYTRHALGMLLVGIEMALFMHFTGHYYTQGVGYAAIMDILRETLANPWFLLLLFAGKYLATCLTLGSGASGGVFSPSLFMGAALGALFGNFCRLLFPALNIDPVFFAVAGMAAMVAGTTGAVLTACIMIFEQTRDYQAILPIITTVGIAYAVRKGISKPSIYTQKLLRRGNPVPEGLEAALDVSQQAGDIMSRSFAVLSANTTPAKILKESNPESPPNYYIVKSDDGSVQVVARQQVEDVSDDEALSFQDLKATPYGWAQKKDSLVHVLRKMKDHNLEVMLISEKREEIGRLVGIITLREVAAMSQNIAYLLE